MPPILRPYLAAALPATALVSLLCGPSSTAAQAAQRADIARQKAVEKRDTRTANLPDAADRDRPAPDQPQQPPSDERPDIPADCSYLAPAAAKPAESKKLHSKTAFVSSPIPTHPETAAVCTCIAVPVEPCFRAHYPAYQAQAPPRR